MNNRVDRLLVLAIILLCGQLSWPSVARWSQRPGPGRVGIAQFQAPTLSEDYLIDLPRNYDDSSNWPLVIFLHGSGAIEGDVSKLRQSGPFSQRHPAIIAAPQCRSRRGWNSDDVANLTRHLVVKYRVDKGRIYLIGHSMGGHGAMQIAAHYPDLFTAIVPISAAEVPNSTNCLVRSSVWVFLGALDHSESQLSAEQLVKAINQAGGAAKLTIIADASHNICQRVCDDAELWHWLLRQIRCAPIDDRHVVSRVRNPQTLDTLTKSVQDSFDR